MPVASSAPNKVDHKKTEVLHDGHFRLEQLTYAAQKYSGEMAEPVIREVLRSGPSVAVLLYDPRADSFILTEQFRIGAFLNGVPDRWLLECVAGMVDEGETPESAARREVNEETGCAIRQIECIGQYLTSPGITDEMATVFVAAADAHQAGGVHGLASEGEDIMTRVLRRDEAFAMMDRGEIPNIVAQLALLWFARHGDGLRQRWLGALVDMSGADGSVLPMGGHR